MPCPRLFRRRTVEGVTDRRLRTFGLPDEVTGSAHDFTLAYGLLDAWRADGILQVAADPWADNHTRAAYAASRRFFRLPMDVKSELVSDLTYTGYIASGEEVTAGEADRSEIFTVCKDVPLDDRRTRAHWPCHGPAPWPDPDYRDAMAAFMGVLGSVGERLLRLVALGLGLEIDALTRLTVDGWHHMRVLRFPAASEHVTRGIGAHTDYGLLVIATQDDVGGLFVRPPVDGEKRPRNWLDHESSAGVFENEEPWHLVPPEPGVFTVFPGDIMQFLTDGYLLSTPHKVTLAGRERFAMAYFHEPNFQACVRPLADPSGEDYIHYGTHFTNMFMRCYPDRITTRRIHREDRLAVLTRLREAASRS